MFVKQSNLSTCGLISILNGMNFLLDKKEYHKNREIKKLKKITNYSRDGISVEDLKNGLNYYNVSYYHLKNNDYQKVLEYIDKGYPVIIGFAYQNNKNYEGHFTCIFKKDLKIWSTNNESIDVLKNITKTSELKTLMKINKKVLKRYLSSIQIGDDYYEPDIILLKGFYGK